MIATLADAGFKSELQATRKSSHASTYSMLTHVHNCNLDQMYWWGLRHLTPDLWIGIKKKKRLFATTTAFATLATWSHLNKQLKHSRRHINDTTTQLPWFASHGCQEPSIILLLLSVPAVPPWRCCMPPCLLWSSQRTSYTPSRDTNHRRRLLEAPQAAQPVTDGASALSLKQQRINVSVRRCRAEPQGRLQQPGLGWLFRTAEEPGRSQAGARQEPALEDLEGTSAFSALEDVWIQQPTLMRLHVLTGTGRMQTTALTGLFDTRRSANCSRIWLWNHREKWGNTNLLH